MSESGPIVRRRPEQLDRVAFSAYLLGAVVPLVALAFVVERYVLPTLADRLAAVGLIGLVISIAALSLGSFLMIRRTTRRSLDRMDSDNRRLASLLRASTSLVGSQHAADAATRAAQSALELTNAPACFVLVRNDSDPHPVPLASCGASADELYGAGGKILTELATLVTTEGRPALRGPSPPQSGGSGEKNVGAVAAVPIPGETGVIGALTVVHGPGDAKFDAAEVDALCTLAALGSVALRHADLRDAQQNFFAHVTKLLVSALDAHLDFHRGHGGRVAQMANLMGRELGLDEQKLQHLHFAALLHDLGMLKMDRKQKMNARTCEKHTLLGARMLAPIRLWRNLAPIVQHHHERWDGSGYPEGLRGEEIPLEARIVGICEAFDTMFSQWSYKVAMPLDEVMEEIEACAGSQFDPKLVRLFAGLVERGAIGTHE